MAQNNNLTEFQELREQYWLIDEKLSKQDDINDTLLRTALERKMNSIRKYYRQRYMMNIACIPITIGFIVLNFHWAFIVLVNIVGIAFFFLDRKAYRILDPDTLFTLNMSDADKRVLKYREWRRMTLLIMAVPGIAMLVWTIYIACGSQWNWPLIMAASICMAGAIVGGFIGERDNMRKLEHTLKQLNEM